MYICIDCRAPSRPRSGVGNVSDSDTKSSAISLRKLSGSWAFHASQPWRAIRRLSCSDMVSSVHQETLGQ